MFWETFIDRWKYVIGGAALALIFLLVFLFKGSGDDFMVAEVAFQKWENNEVLDNKLFEELSSCLKKHPELHAKYDDQIAQKLLAHRLLEEALPFVNKALNRVTWQRPEYTLFTEASLSISRGEYEQGYEAAKRLIDSLKGAKDFDLLRAFAYIRKAFLEQKLKLSQEELKSWSLVRQLISDENSTISRPLLAHFRTQEVSLLDYISHRELSLMQ